VAAIIPFLNNEAFEPQDIKAMSTALDDVCRVLKVRDASSQQVFATRIIDLARRGERSPMRLRDRLLQEARQASVLDLPANDLRSRRNFA
jgi:hypothetical protein